MCPSMRILMGHPIQEKVQILGHHPLRGDSRCSPFPLTPLTAPLRGHDGGHDGMQMTCASMGSATTVRDPSPRPSCLAATKSPGTAGPAAAAKFYRHLQAWMLTIWWSPHALSTSRPILEDSEGLPRPSGCGVRMLLWRQPTLPSNSPLYQA